MSNIESQNHPIQKPEKIKILPEFLIDQIQAGEVVEKPASLLKELLENSVDAGSRTIRVFIKNNGLDLIRITDDGCGINFSDLPFAFSRHATSKISEYNDLFKLKSYGFRGEALASAASISRVLCKSMPRGESSGGVYGIEGGIEKEHYKVEGLENGTIIEIKDLFFNTPARLKFIKSQTAEKNALKNILNCYLLTHPQIEFHLKWDDKEWEIYKKSDESARFQKIIGKKKAEFLDLFSIENEYDGIKVKGSIISSIDTKGSARNFFIFVNQRPIEDRSIHFLVNGSFQKILKNYNIYGYYLDIDVPPNSVDINVHPNKTTIKFEETGKVFAVIKSAILNSIQDQTKTIAEDSINPSSSFDQNLFATEITNSKDVKLKTYEGFKEKHIALKEELGLFNSISNEHSKNSEISILIQPFVIFNALEKQDHEKLIINFQELYFSWIHNLNLTQSEIAPLLISLPFELNQKLNQRETKELIEVLENYNLQFDQLGEDSLVLRAVPESIIQDPLNLVIPILVNKISKSEVLKTRSEVNLFKEISFLKIKKIIDSSISTLGISELIQRKIAKVINKESLQAFLQGK